MQPTGNGFDWIESEEDENRLMGPEDYAWAAASLGHSFVARVPDLAWIWDSSPTDLTAFQLSVAMQQPLGSA